jgi:transposase-like protein
MTRRARRNHLSAFKAKFALAAAKGEHTPAELAEQLDVHPNQMQDWKRRPVESAGWRAPARGVPPVASNTARASGGGAMQKVLSASTMGR